MPTVTFHRRKEPLEGPAQHGQVFFVGHPMLGSFLALMGAAVLSCDGEKAQHIDVPK